MFGKIKPIEELSKATLKRKLKAFNERETLSAYERAIQRRMENRLDEIDRAENSPVSTPKGFIENDDVW